MSEKPIRRNTIVSTTDKRLTLLQWLKQVQGQLNDLKEKGVKAVVEEFDTPEAFYNAYATKPAGTPVLAIVADDTAIMGTLSEITDKLILKGTIYKGGKMYTGAEADSLNIVGGGELAGTSYVDAIAETLKLSYDYYGDNDKEMYDRWNSETHNVGDFVKIMWKGRTYGDYRCVFGQIYSLTSDYVYIAGFACTDMASGRNAHIVAPVKLRKWSDNYAIEGTSYPAYDDPRLNGVYSSFLHSGGAYSNSYVGGGFRTISESGYTAYRYGAMGCFDDYGNQFPKEAHAQCIIFDRRNVEVYYPVNGYITCTKEGVVGNAISGTQLKEAVQRATQKTYWHSVKIKGANGIFTFNAPSTLNTPVVSTEKLLELFNNDTWAGFGKVGTDMLFAIRLINGNIEFTKADDTSVSIGAFGTIDISDDVKEVK